MNFLQHAIRLIAYHIDKSKLNTLWYENEDGDKYVPDLEKMDGPDDVPDGYKYQVSQFPTYLRTTYLRLTPDGSEEMMAGESGWSEDLVLAMAESGDFTLSEAILVAAQACSRCMNALAHDYGLDWGYKEGSEEWQKANTRCEFCTTPEEWKAIINDYEEEPIEDATMFATEAATFTRSTEIRKLKREGWDVIRGDVLWTVIVPEGYELTQTQQFSVEHGFATRAEAWDWIIDTYSRNR